MDRREEILRLRAKGLSYREISECTGAAKSVISYHLTPGEKTKAGLRTKRLRDLKRQRVRDYKESNPCIDCKMYYPYYVMDFDHLESRGKIDNVSRLIAKNKGIEVILAEIEKCELVCANCHRVRTNARLDKEIE